VLLRAHDPLAFGYAELSDLIDAAWLWFEGSAAAAGEGTGAAAGGGAAAGAAAGPGAAPRRREERGGGGGGEDRRLWPFFLWNCLPRAGASQYHGHAQTTLTRDPLPLQQQLSEAAARHAARHAPGGGGGADGDGDGVDAEGPCYYSDLLRAHRAVGLLRQVTLGGADGEGSDGGGSDGGGSSLPGRGPGGGSSSSLSSSSSGGGGAGGGAAGAGTWGGTAWGFASLGGSRSRSRGSPPRAALSPSHPVHPAGARPATT
jgi:hypothetical protein